MVLDYSELNRYEEAANNIEQFSPINIFGLKIFECYVNEGIIPIGDPNLECNVSDSEFKLLSYFDFTFDNAVDNELDNEIYTNIGLLIDKEKIEVYLTMALLKADIQATKVKTGLSIETIRNGKIEYKKVDDQKNAIYTDSLSQYLFWCDYVYTCYNDLTRKLNHLLSYYLGEKDKEKVNKSTAVKKENSKPYEFEDLFNKKYKKHHILFFEALKHSNLALLSESNVWIGQESDSYTYYKILLQKDIIQEKNVAQAARLFAVKFGVNRHNFQHGSKAKPSAEKLELFATTIQEVITDIHLFDKT